MTKRALAGALAFLTALSAQATAVLALSFEEMTARSTAVVRGTAGASEAHWDPTHRHLFTYTEIRADEILKGRAPAVMLVRSPGGEAEGLGQRVEGSPRFSPGEAVVVFLEPVADEPTTFQVMALAAGKVTLALSNTGEPRATRDLSGITPYALGSIDRQPHLEVRTTEDLGRAEAFVARIRTAAKRAAQ
jgi:hypothetical protein